MPTPQQKSRYHYPSAAFPAFAMNIDDVSVVSAQPLASLAAELYQFHQEWRAVIFKGNALHLIEEHPWVVVANYTVGRNACVTEIEDEKGRVVLERQEAGDNVAVVAIRRVVAKGRSRHGDDPVRDVS
jgi:hypothetical protein